MTYVLVEGNVENRFEKMGECVAKAHRAMTASQKRGSTDTSFCPSREIRIYRDLGNHTFEWVAFVTSKNTEVYYDYKAFIETQMDRSWQQKPVRKKKTTSQKTTQGT